jgi:hypothetical protein
VCVLAPAVVFTVTTVSRTYYYHFGFATHVAGFSLDPRSHTFFLRGFWCAAVVGVFLSATKELCALLQACSASKDRASAAHGAASFLLESDLGFDSVRWTPFDSTGHWIQTHIYGHSTEALLVLILLHWLVGQAIKTPNTLLLVSNSQHNCRQCYAAPRLTLLLIVQVVSDCTAVCP